MRSPWVARAHKDGDIPCRSCRRLRSLPFFKIKRSQSSAAPTGRVGRYSAQTALSLVQLTDVLEDFTAGSRRLVLRNLMLGLTDQGTQLLAVRVRVVDDEFFQNGIVAGDQTIAPALQVMEAFVVLTSGGIELIEQNQNGGSVLIAHQFADELKVPFTRDVRGVLGRIGQS